MYRIQFLRQVEARIHAPPQRTCVGALRVAGAHSPDHRAAVNSPHEADGRVLRTNLSGNRPARQLTPAAAGARSSSR